MAAPVRIDELTAGSLSAAAAVAVVIGGFTKQVTASSFINEASSFTPSGSSATTVAAELILNNKKATTWYVDSSAGDDNSRGVSDDTALASITELLTKDINEGDTILLKRGSTWREKLTAPVNKLKIEAYGTGNAPILDGADTISTSAWSLSSGNVYQATLTVETTNSAAAEWTSIWENSTRLVQVADEATCDSTAGSYYPVLVGTTLTLKLHATGSGNPSTNGKTYEYAKRSSCIDTFSVKGCVVRGINTKRQFQSYGSLTLGIDCEAYDCTASEGNTHNVFARKGARLYRVTAQDGYAFNSSITLFVHYEDDPEDGDVLYEDCVATQTTANAGGEFGFYGHSDGSSGDWGTITFSRCAGTGCDDIFGGANTALIVIEDPSGSDFSNAIRPNADTVITGGSGPLTTARASSYLVTAGAANIEITVDGLTGSVTNTGGGAFQVTTNGVTLNLYRNNISWKSNLVTFSGTGGTLNSYGNTFIPLAGAARAYWLTGNPTLTSDRNDFGGITDASQPPFIIDSTSYGSFEMYKSGAGKDTNSSNGRIYIDQDVIKLIDHFVGVTLDANKWRGRVGSNGSCVAPALRTDRINGEVEMTTGADAGATMALNGVQMETALSWRPNMGGFVLEGRVSMSVATNVSFFFGVTDQNSILEMPFTMGASDTLTSNCADGCGILFDTGGDTDEWCLVGVANGADATKQFLGIAPTANVLETFRIEVTTGGVASFYRNGVKVGTTMAAATRIGVAHTPFMGGFSRTNVTRTFYADYLLMQGNRLPTLI